MASKVRSLFPNLAAKNINRLLISGLLKVPALKVVRYWKRLGIKVTDYVSLDRTYTSTDVNHFARLLLSIQNRKTVRMLIDVSTRPIQFIQSSGKLNQKILLDFCRWIITQQGVEGTTFNLRAISEFRYRRKLPFTLGPTGEEVFLSGIKFGFTKKRSLHFLTMERDRNQVIINLQTRPTLRLDPNRFNERFFDGVIDLVSATVRAFH